MGAGELKILAAGVGWIGAAEARLVLLLSEKKRKRQRGTRDWRPWEEVGRKKKEGSDETKGASKETARRRPKGARRGAARRPEARRVRAEGGRGRPETTVGRGAEDAENILSEGRWL